MADEATAGFDEVIHPPLRLRTCGLLRPVDRLEFTALRDTLGVSDPTLSKNLRVLLDCGYASIEKQASTARADRRLLAWVSLTPAGRAAFDGHMAELRRIAGSAT